MRSHRRDVIVESVKDGMVRYRLRGVLTLRPMEMPFAEFETKFGVAIA